MATKILKKLTIRDVIGSKLEILKIAEKGRTKATDAEGKEVLSPIGTPMPLVLVLGKVDAIKPGESDNGPYVKLMGVFEATNLQTGEVISDVGMAILPNFVATPIASAVAGGAIGVQFAVELQVRFNETAVTMYEFEAVSHMPAVEAAPIAAIKAQLLQSGAKLPALPAPKAEAPAPAPTPAPAPAEAPKAANKRK